MKKLGRNLFTLWLYCWKVIRQSPWNLLTDYVNVQVHMTNLTVAEVLP